MLTSTAGGDSLVLVSREQAIQHVAHEAQAGLHLRVQRLEPGGQTDEENVVGEIAEGEALARQQDADEQGEVIEEGWRRDRSTGGANGGTAGA